MDIEITKRDSLLQKASHSIQILSKENESLQQILQTRNAEILNLQQKNAKSETELNSVQKQYNDSLIVSAKNLQRSITSSGLETPSNLTVDAMFINQLNTIDLKNQQQTSIYKKQLQIQHDEETKILSQKVELLKQENQSLKLSDQDLRKMLDDSNDQIMNYRKEINANNDELRRLRGIETEYKFLQGKHEETSTQYSKVFTDFQNIFQSNEKHASELQNQLLLNSNLQDSNQTLLKQLEQLQSEFNTIQKQNFELSTQQESNTITIQSLEAELTKFSQELSHLKLEQTKLIDINEQLSSEKNCFTDQINELDQQLKSLEENKRKSDQQNLQNQAEIEAGNQAKIQLEHQEQNLVNLKQELEQTVNNYQNINQHYFELKQSSETNNLRVQELEFLLQQNQQELSLCQEQNLKDKQTIDAFIDKISNNEQQIQQISFEKVSISTQLQELSNENLIKMNSQSNDIQSQSTKIQALENQVLEKNQRILDLTEESSNFDIQQKLLKRLLEEITTECGVQTANNDQSRNVFQEQFQLIVREIQSKKQQIKEAQTIIQEYQSATEKLNDKILKQEQILKMARDDIQERIDNENNLVASLNELQKQVHILNDENNLLKQRIEQDDNHKNKLKKYVNDCKDRIEDYENQSSEYYEQLKSKELNVEKQVYNLQKTVSQNITEFSQSVLSKLRNGDKESAISDILKLHKTFLV